MLHIINDGNEDLKRKKERQGKGNRTLWPVPDMVMGVWEQKRNCRRDHSMKGYPKHLGESRGEREESTVDRARARDAGERSGDSR